VIDISELFYFCNEIFFLCLDSIFFLLPILNNVLSIAMKNTYNLFLFLGYSLFFAISPLPHLLPAICAGLGGGGARGAKISQKKRAAPVRAET
jgi:hypothetical protein